MRSGRADRPRVGRQARAPCWSRYAPDGVYRPLRPGRHLQRTAGTARPAARRCARIGGQRIGPATADVWPTARFDARDGDLPWLLAPCDLQAIKAAGVTFVASMLERVIEEQARGDPARAEAVRRPWSP